MIDWQSGEPPTDIGEAIIVWNGGWHKVAWGWFLPTGATSLAESKQCWHTPVSEIRMITHWARIQPPAGEKEEAEYP